MNRLASLFLLPAALLALPLVASADDDDDRRGHGKHQRSSKQTYYDGNCKVEQKIKKNGQYEEKRKCKGPSYSAYQPAPVLVPAPIYYAPSPGITINGSFTLPR